jgi:hypothetical protein
MSDTKKNKLSIRDKYDIISKLQIKCKRSDILSDYKLKHLSHLTHLWQKKDDIIAKYSELNGKSNEKYFRLTTSKYPNVKIALIKWMRQMR